MSYDLVVFEPEVPPRDRNGFLTWYEEEIRSAKSPECQDETVTSRALGAWFREMIEEYPPLNGALALEPEESSRCADYSFGRSFIYVNFSWSEAAAALEWVMLLARHYRLGFFNVSATNGSVWVPDARLDYVCIHGEDAGSTWPRKFELTQNETRLAWNSLMHETPLAIGAALLFCLTLVLGYFGGPAAFLRKPGIRWSDGDTILFTLLFLAGIWTLMGLGRLWRSWRKYRNARIRDIVDTEAESRPG